MSIFTNRASRSVEEAQSYTEAILGLLGARDPIAVLRATPDGIRQAIASLSEQQLSTPEGPDKWSMRQVIRHLADSDLVWGYRVRLVLAQDRPVITGYDQDLWAERLRYDQAPIDQALDEFTTLRRGNLRLVEAASAADLKRVGVHSERGEESVAHMINMYAGHDLLHLAQLTRIRHAIGG